MKEKIEQVIRELEEKASECENRFKKTREGFSMGAFSAFSESAEMLRQVIEDDTVPNTHQTDGRGKDDTTE